LGTSTTPLALSSSSPSPSSPPSSSSWKKWNKYEVLDRKAMLGPMARRKRTLGLPMREKEKLSFVTDCPPGLLQWTLANKVVDSPVEYLTTASSQCTRQAANLVHCQGQALPFFQTKGSQEFISGAAAPTAAVSLPLPTTSDPFASTQTPQSDALTIPLPAADGAPVEGGAEWVCLDFRPWVITPESYALASYHPIQQGPVPRNWELQCSMDGSTWRTLRSHVEDDTISGDSDFGVWDIPPVNLTDGWSAKCPYKKQRRLSRSRSIDSSICSGGGGGVSPGKEGDLAGSISSPGVANVTPKKASATSPSTTFLSAPKEEEATPSAKVEGAPEDGTEEEGGEEEGEGPKTERWPCSMLRIVATGLNSLGSTHLQVAALEVYGRILCSAPGSSTEAKASYFAASGPSSSKSTTVGGKGGSQQGDVPPATSDNNKKKQKPAPLPPRALRGFTLPLELPPEPVKKKGKKAAKK
jgi:hypothetical protein